MDKKIKLVLDLGHGGNDPGAASPYMAAPESKINLNIGLILKAIFSTHPAYEIIMTRNKDLPLPLHERTALANENQARLISIHCNASTNRQAEGSEVWCFSKDNRDGSISEGYKLSQSISEELAAIGLKNRGVKTIYDRSLKKYIARPYWVLRRTSHPSVLIECGFISNQGDANKLDIDLDGFNEELAAAIFKGIDKILNKKGGEVE